MVLFTRAPDTSLLPSVQFVLVDFQTVRGKAFPFSIDGWKLRSDTNTISMPLCGNATRGASSGTRSHSGIQQQQQPGRSGENRGLRRDKPEPNPFPQLLLKTDETTRSMHLQRKEHENVTDMGRDLSGTSTLSPPLALGCLGSQSFHHLATTLTDAPVASTGDYRSF